MVSSCIEGWLLFSGTMKKIDRVLPSIVIPWVFPWIGMQDEVKMIV